MTQSAPTKLWNKNFLLWWLGAAQSALGSSLATIATSFLVLHQTGSSGAMGINLALALIPALFSPFFGTLVDRIPIKPPLVIGNVLRAALQLGVGFLALRGQIAVEVIYAASFLTGLVGAFYSPAAMGITPRLVPPTELERAAGLMQGTVQTMGMVGLIGGGFLVATIGKAQALIIDGLSFLVFAFLLLLIQFPARAAKAKATTFWQDFRAGATYVRGSAMLIGLPLMAMLINASLAPLEMLIPARMVALGTGEKGYGLFFGALLAGMAGGSFLIAALGKRVNARPASVAGLLGAGLSVMLIGLSRTDWQMYAFGICMGVFIAFTNMGIGVIFQKRIDPAYYGRVGSLLSLLGTVGQPVALLTLAPVADRVSLSVLLGVAGTLMVISAVVWRELMRRDPVMNSKPSETTAASAEPSNA